ncbi:hypothetical protein J2T13_002830 [Paenibacillus sp. DS2015]|uniref:hypothetical protein n=1 Tax=Paenibacillus sp. DS2015 TaxID=3373917 RepID=UPI003D1F4CD2
MSYDNINLQGKVVKMLANRTPEIELSGDELNSLAKKKMIEYLDEHKQSVDITGVNFEFNGQEVDVALNGKWGLIPFGATVTFHMESEGDNLILNHRSTTIRKVNIPNSFIPESLSTIRISLKDHLPNVVEVDKLKFSTDGIILSFKIDSSLIPSLLLDKLGK